MMKTTQFLTNIKLWQGIFFSFLLLVSLNLNSQNVGDDLLANSNGMVDTTSGATGSGGGCFSTGNNGSPGGTYDGSTECGWTSAAGLNYAPSTGGHGPTHSGDRMFKSYKTNGSAGEFIAQEVGELALGTYTYSFFHRWTGGSIDYTEGAPKFTIKEQNADGGWDNVLVVDLAEGNTGASGEWTETTGTWVNENVNNYKIQVYKNGAANAGLAQNLHLDSFSFVYTEAASSGGVTAPWTDDFEDGDNSDWTILTAADASQGWVLANGTNGSIVMYHGDDNVSSGVDNYLASPVIDMSGLTSPLLSYSERGSYASYYTFHGVYTSSDYTGDVAAATWTLLTEGVAPGTEAVQEFSIPNTTTGIAFRYQGDYSDTWEIDNVSVTETPTEPSMEVSASTDGGSATFSFDVENFTVGAAGDTGVDGHIHYSLNGGSTVMVYSADDLTLSDLPNGDHTIVFELVDDAHASLDPAVTATVEFSTFDGTAECGDTYTYTQVNSNTFTLSVTAPEGQNVSVTVNGQLETNYDSMTITDSTGNVIAEQVDGTFADSVFEADGTMNITVSNDSSVNYGDIVFAFSCAAATTNVTFSVNTENIEVGANGIYVGGGVLGGSDAYALSDDDGDGVWVTTLALAPGTTGNYAFFNSPNGSSDWGTKEVLTGQDCADPANYDDRILDPVGEEDYTLLHCFGECSGNGTGECPAPATTYDVTFSVDMSNYPGGGLVDGDIVYLNGTFVGWCGDCTPMSDDDGDGIWTVTVALEDGDYEYKFTVNGWNAQETWPADGTPDCAENTDDGSFENRTFTVAGADMTLETVFWNLCAGETPGQVYNLTFAVDTANITVGDSGMYLGGGGFGNAQGHLMSDDDGDGVYEVTVEVSTDQAGSNYIFLNGPGDGGDWGAKEDLEGQECADTGNYNDRILPEFDADTYLLHCFGDCSGDGVGCAASEDGMMELQGIIDFTVPSGGSDGKAIHVLVTADIADLSNYGIGVANNGGGTDGEEYFFPEGSATAGQHILVARSLEAMEAYGMTGFDQVLEASSDISQNGDDAIELYFGGGVIEVFGDVDVDGTGEAWEYMDSWAYKVEGAWTYGEVNCTDGSTTTCDSGCPYPFVECAAPVTFPLCEDFEDGTEGWTFVDLGGLTSDWQIDTPANGDSTASLGHGYLPQDAAYDDWAISPSYDTSGLAEGTATVSYFEYLNWSADATAHNVWYATDYAGDPTTATWELLNDVIGTDAEDVFVQRTFSIPSAESIVIGFQFNSTYGADWNIDDMCIDGTLSNTDNEILDMMVYPNPVDGNYVTIVTPVQGSKEIQVFTVTGRKVMDTVINGNTLDVSSFNSGFYMLKVTVDGQSKISKLVVR